MPIEPINTQPHPKRRKLFSDLQGYSGKESCIRSSENDPECKVVGNGTRHYAEYVNFESTAFSGYRGPFCSAACYRKAYPEDPRVEAALEVPYVEVDQVTEYGQTFRLQRSIRVF